MEIKINVIERLRIHGYNMVLINQMNKYIRQNKLI